MSDSKRNSLVTNTAWASFGQIGYLGVLFGTNMILSRILSPKEFGQVGIVMFFIAFAAVMAESGFSGALIRSKNVDEKHYSTFFIFNLLVSIFLFFCFFLISNFVAEFYNDSTLKNIIIVSSLVLITNSFNFVQNTRLIREFNFKLRALLSFCSIFLSSLLAIFLAYKGFGVWSLVFLQLGNSVFYAIFLWINKIPFRKLIFDKVAFLEMYKFGMNTTFSSLLDSIFENIYQLVIGKFFSINQVGFFYQGKRIQEMPMGLLNMLTQGVIYSHLSKLQDDKNLFEEKSHTILNYFLVILAFFSGLIFIYADSIILIVLGEKWLEAVFFMKMLIVGSFFYFIELYGRMMLKIIDKTKSILYLEYVKKIIQAVTVILAVLMLNLKVLIIGFVSTNLLSGLFYYYFSQKTAFSKIDKFSLKKNITLILIIIITGFLMIIFNNFLSLNKYLKLATLPIFLMVYSATILVFKIVDMNEIKTIIKFKK